MNLYNIFDLQDGQMMLLADDGGVFGPYSNPIEAEEFMDWLHKRGYKVIVVKIDGRA